jgi:hypothetical protein
MTAPGEQHEAYVVWRNGVIGWECECGGPWPCEVVRLADEAGQRRTQVARTAGEIKTVTSPDGIVHEATTIDGGQMCVCGNQWPCLRFLIAALGQARADQVAAIRDARAVMNSFDEVGPGQFWSRGDE